MSIQARWTLGYVLLVVAVLVAFGLAFYFVSFSRLSSQIDDQLEAQAHQALGIVRAQAAHAPLITVKDVGSFHCLQRLGLGSLEPFTTAAKLANTSFQLLVVQPVCASGMPNGNGLPPVALNSLPQIPQFQATPRSGTSEPGIFRAVIEPAWSPPPPRTVCKTLSSVGERTCLRYVLAHVPIPLKDGGGEAAIILWRSLSTLSATQAKIKNLLLVLLPLAVALACVLGLLTAIGVARPLRLMTRQVRSIERTGDLRLRVSAGSTRDEIGQLASAFNGMMDRLQAVFEQQRRFVGDASHEMRTPLTAIIGNSDLLSHDIPREGEAREALNMIRREAGRLSRLVNDLLMLAELDAGQRLVMAPVELDTLLLEVYQQARRISEDVRIRLGDVAPIIVNADADRIRQLLLNLVDNAIKYTPAGGTVTLALDEVEGFARICVTDTGVGIPAEDLPHIFDRFYRADKSRSGRPGAGLGLSISRWIVDAHGGSIRVESAVNVGTTFIVELPLPGADGAAPLEPRVMGMTGGESALSTRLRGRDE